MKRLALILLVAYALTAPAPAADAPGQVRLKPGDPFPDLEFYGLLAPEDYPHLGLPRRDGPVRLSDIPGEVLVLEFFNKSCVPCQRQVREVEAFYQELGRRGLRDRVRLLAVAAGNQPKYLGKYRKKRRLTYPITADPQFDQWRRVGGAGRTPFTVFLVRRDGRWLLARYSFGVQQSRELLAHGLALLANPETALAQNDPGIPLSDPTLVLPVDALGVRERARQLFRRATGETEVDAVELELGNGVRVYQAASGGRRLPAFAKLASRPPVCEVCEAVHFLFAFDRSGKILGFEPIHVTKYGNEPWSPEDNRFFEGRLRGRTLKDLSFDPEVDAVAMATMSSALIFDEIRRTLPLLERLPAGDGG